MEDEEILIPRIVENPVMKILLQITGFIVQKTTNVVQGSLQEKNVQIPADHMTQKVEMNRFCQTCLEIDNNQS